MNISNISTNQVESFIPREIKVENNKQNVVETPVNDVIKLNPWQKDILTNAIDKLLNNIQLDNSHPLKMAENKPLESYQEALNILEEINSESLRNFGSQAQANVSAYTFMQLMIEE